MSNEKSKRKYGNGHFLKAYYEKGLDFNEYCKRNVKKIYFGTYAWKYYTGRLIRRTLFHGWVHVRYDAGVENYLFYKCYFCT